MWGKALVLSGLMLPLCRSFLSNSLEAESLSTERIPNQISLYSRLPELLAQNHTALQHVGIYANILLSPLQAAPLFLSLSWLTFMLGPPPILNPPTLPLPGLPPHTLQPIRLQCLKFKKKTKNGKWNCGRIPPVQVSVMCCDERTQRHRGLLIMEHTGPLAAAAPTGDAEGGGRGGERRSEWVTVEPTEHRTRAKEFRRHAGGDAWGWKLGISQKIRGGGRDGAQKHRGVQRRREGGEVPLPLRFALLLTRAGGRASDCT